MYVCKYVSIYLSVIVKLNYQLDWPPRGFVKHTSGDVCMWWRYDLWVCVWSLVPPSLALFSCFASQISGGYSSPNTYTHRYSCLGASRPWIGYSQTSRQINHFFLWTVGIGCLVPATRKLSHPVHLFVCLSITLSLSLPFPLPFFFFLSFFFSITIVIKEISNTVLQRILMLLICH